MGCVCSGLFQPHRSLRLPNTEAKSQDTAHSFMTVDYLSHLRSCLHCDFSHRTEVFLEFFLLVGLLKVTTLKIGQAGPMIFSYLITFIHLYDLPDSCGILRL